MFSGYVEHTENTMFWTSESKESKGSENFASSKALKTLNVPKYSKSSEDFGSSGGSEDSEGSKSFKISKRFQWILPGTAYHQDRTELHSPQLCSIERYRPFW